MKRYESTDPVSPTTAYVIAQVQEHDPKFAQRIEGAWRVMMALQRSAA